MPGIAGRRVDPPGDGLAAVVSKDLDHRLVDEDAKLERFAGSQLEGAGFDDFLALGPGLDGIDLQLFSAGS